MWIREPTELPKVFEREVVIRAAIDLSEKYGKPLSRDEAETLYDRVHLRREIDEMDWPEVIEES